MKSSRTQPAQLTKSEIMCHFILSMSSDFPFSDQRAAKNSLFDSLLDEFSRISTFNYERLSSGDLFTVSFDQGSSEAKLGFTFDHHAFAIMDYGLERLRLPRGVIGIKPGKTFQSYVQTSKDELRRTL